MPAFAASQTAIEACSIPMRAPKLTHIEPKHRIDWLKRFRSERRDVTLEEREQPDRLSEMVLKEPDQPDRRIHAWTQESVRNGARSHRNKQFVREPDDDQGISAEAEHDNTIKLVGAFLKLITIVHTKGLGKLAVTNISEPGNFQLPDDSNDEEIDPRMTARILLELNSATVVKHQGRTSTSPVMHTQRHAKSKKATY
ncbi:uncharacterized protein LOC100871240 [Anopheles sinensis]|uniref:Uncharacterized protein LOC100871240 n=1 Tax=Anopheles sinensis TaxID=74873 RepID=A0A084VD48_ANOSI|nr:uncharacterized protein LOC100871240 [Anopheles sinensis]